ncbi:kinase-like protein [Athelia psychrophila]|uniref:Kinase-like protein n=1 Tax=Athelia psychrophila TaxID=1759441 RepID=A0A166F6H7_9AGAM|nr:kinase-like protein [Fibularhizoctonia sp. CBS 109695]
MAARNRTARRTRISYDARHPETRDLTALITGDTGFAAISHPHKRVYKGNMNDGPATTVVSVKHNLSYRATEADWIKVDVRTRREIVVWKRLDHPNIVALLGTTTEESPWQSTGMVSRWMVNGNLGTFVTPSLPLAHRQQITCDVAAGLAYLHSEGIIHGDLEATNVLINEDGNACLIDFSLSSITSEFEGTEFTPDIIGGALRFRALEISPPVDGHYQDFNPELTFACDVYSLGSVILQVLSSLQPYYNIPSDIMIALALARKTKPERPVSTPLTDTYWKFIQGCWCDTPENRPSAANAHEQFLRLRT